MTWKWHSATSVCISYAVFASPTVTAGALVAARFPDVIEAFLPGVKHRGLSHVLLFWIASSVFLFGLPEFRFLFGLFLGALLHVLMDGCSAHGVPIISSAWRFRLRLYKTGRSSEYIFALLICGLFLAGAVLAMEFHLREFPRFSFDRELVTPHYTPR